MKKKKYFNRLINFMMTIVMVLSAVLAHGIPVHANAGSAFADRFDITVQLSNSDYSYCVSQDIPKPVSEGNPNYGNTQSCNVYVDSEVFAEDSPFIVLSYKASDLQQLKITSFTNEGYTEDGKTTIPDTYIVVEKKDYTNDGFYSFFFRLREENYNPIDYGKYKITIGMKAKLAANDICDNHERKLVLNFIYQKRTSPEASQTFTRAANDTFDVSGLLAHASNRYNYRWTKNSSAETLGTGSSYTPSGAKSGDTYICHVSRKDESTTTGCTGSDEWTYTYNIKPRAEWSKKPTAKELSYTGKSVQLFNPGTSSQGTVYYYYPSDWKPKWTTDVLSMGYPSTYQVQAKIVPNNDNYAESEIYTFECKMDKAKGSFSSVPVAVKNLAYSTGPQNLVTTGVGKYEAVVEYALGTDEETAPTTGWSTNIPQGTEAGDYFVWYKVQEDEYNYASTPVVVKATIGKANPAIPTDISGKYGMKLKDIELPEGWEWDDADQILDTVGTVDYKANYEGSKNYKAVSADVSVQVAKAIPECEAPEAIEELTYTGFDQALITEGEVPEGCEMQYKLGEDGTYSSEIPQAKDAGTHTVYWKIIGNENYEDYESPTGVDVIIKKATPTLAWEDQTVIANGEAANITAPTATFIGEDSPEVNFTYAYRVQGEEDYTEGLPSACGIYDIKGKIVETDNYGIAEKNMTLTIDCTDANTDGFCDYCGSPVEVEAVDGWYPIANKGNLLWFASAVNAGQTTMNAKLTADIDLKGEKWSIMNSFAGTIEGNGHTISGLCKNAGLDDGARHGFIRILESTGVVRNLTFDDADVFNHEGSGATTAVIAYTNLGMVENCVVKNSTIQHGNYDSMCAVVANNHGTIKNCASISNTLRRRFSSGKALAGFVWENNGVITGCYSYDCNYISGGERYAFAQSNSGRIIDCYYYENDTVSDSVAISKSAEQFASGEATFLLNGSTNTGNVSWYQNLTGEGADAYPVLNNTHGVVYYVFKCDGKTPVYRNVNENESHVDNDENGYCDNCEKLPTSVTVNGKVELENNTLTYGEALSKLTFKEVEFVDSEGNVLEGTLTWDNPDLKPDVKDVQAVWLFTPEDEELQVVRGTVPIVVNKAVPVATEVPTVNVIQYHPSGKLNSVALLGGTVTGVEDNTLAGTWKWKNADTTPIVNNDGYVAVFTPQDDMHYEAIEETVEVPVKKADANLSIARTSYEKGFTSKDFVLEDISYTGDGVLTYSVRDEKTLDGEAKAAGSVVSVSDEGIVSINGVGSANIYVGVSESDNYMAAKPQIINVNVGLVDQIFVECDKNYIYTGKAIKPEVVVYDGLNGILTKGKDYTVTYKNNVNACVSGDEFDPKKNPHIIIKGKGVYQETIMVPFNILPKDISGMEDESIVVKEILLEENGKVQKKVPSITYNKKKMTGVLKPEDGSEPAKVKDFVYSYPELVQEETKDTAFKAAGTWKILVEGTGNYTGERDVDVVIATKGGKMTSAKIKGIPAQEYTGEAIDLTAEELQVTGKINGQTETLTRDVHYSVQYKNNKEIGTATVIITGIPAGGFSGTKSATFKITGTSIAKAKVEGITAKTYNGKAQTQNVTVSVTKKVETENGSENQNITLVKDRDYTVTYDKNVNVGTAKMTIKGIGAYTGTIKKTFKINQYNMSGETDATGKTKFNSPLTEANGLFEMTDGQLSVKYVKGGVKPGVKLFFNGTMLTEGKDYTVSYKNNKGVYVLTEGDEGYKKSKAPTLTIKGKGNFKGNVSKTFVITERKLAEEGQAVVMTVADKAVSTAKGGYISKPVLTDADGKVLSQGKDYTAPVYTIAGENDETITLGKKDKVETVGTVVTVTVKGLGAYGADAEEEMSATYVITEKNFGSVKVSSISKPYTGSKVTLTEADFYNEDGTSKVTIGSGKNKVELKYGVDFEIVEGSYKNNVKKGTASVTLRGKGTYGGTKTIKFKVGTRGFGDWNWWGLGTGE